WHAMPDNAIRQNPEECARSCLLYFFCPQIRSLLSALCLHSMAFCAVLFKELSASANGIRIVFERVALGACFLRNFRQGSIFRLVCSPDTGVFTLCECRGSHQSEEARS